MTFDNHLTGLEENFQTLRCYKLKLNPRKCTFFVGVRKFIGYMIFEKEIDANLKKINTIIDMPE